MIQNFLGKDGFIWWIGIVENRVDPMGLGRCQVRIFGWHFDGTEKSKMKIPVEDLPWALPLLPVNGSKNFSTPEKDDWVVGFFMDSAASQFPIMMGVLPGFIPTTKDKSFGGA